MKATRLLAVGDMRGIAADELAKFQSLRASWWDPTGPLRSLHLFNPTRIRYITEVVQRFGGGVAGASAANAASNDAAFSAGVWPLASRRVLDVGCGGGVLSEGLARAGATVLGVDAGEDAVAVAEARLSLWRAEGLPAEMDWTPRLSYRVASLFALAEEQPAAFDVVVASEVVEHVSDARGFVRALCKLTKPGGLLVLTTMDKSLRAAFTHLLIAEHLTGLVELGTHDWRKFIPPKDMTAFTARFGVRNVDLQYILTYPDLFPSLATRDLQVNFKLTRSFDTGHYFWTGLKSHAPAQG